MGPLVNNETTFTYFRWIRNVRLIDIVNVKIVFLLLIQILYKFQAIEFSLLSRARLFKASLA